MKPLLDVVKALQISCIINDDDTMSTTIVTRSNSTKPFLSSSIPLKLNSGIKNYMYSENLINLQFEV